MIRIGFDRYTDSIKVTLGQVRLGLVRLGWLQEKPMLNGFSSVYRVLLVLSECFGLVFNQSLPGFGHSNSVNTRARSPPINSSNYSSSSLMFTGFYWVLQTVQVDFTSFD